MKVAEVTKFGQIYERFPNYSVYDMLMTVTTTQCPKWTQKF